MDPLQFVPIEKWQDIQKVFLEDWPRSMPGYNVLGTQVKLKENGYDYGFRVYSPFGDLMNGFVGVNEKDLSYEVIIQYPKDDTKILEETLRRTKIINWDRKIILPYTSFHVIHCIENILDEKNLELKLLPSLVFYLEKGSKLFENIRLPQDCTLELLSPEHAKLIDSKWPHRYPSSIWYFQLLINTKSGYGLFKGGELTSWVFISESGNITHLYTLEEHRRKGYAEMILKLISNELLAQNNEVVAFCVKGNSACKLYEKVGFLRSHDVTWGYLNKKTI